MTQRRLSTLAMAAMLAFAASSLVAQHAPGRPPLAAPRADRSNVIESQMPIGFDFPPLAARAFRSTTVIPLQKGMVLPSRGIIGPLGMDRMLSLRQHDFRIGSQRVRYPVISLVRCSNFPDTGEFVMVIASTVTLQTKLGSGQRLHGGGFLLETRRAFQAGETIPAVRVIFHRKRFLFSLEPAAGSPPQPALSAAQEGLSAADQAVALEAWRLSMQSAGMGVPH